MCMNILYGYAKEAGFCFYCFQLLFLSIMMVNRKIELIQNHSIFPFINYIHRICKLFQLEYKNRNKIWMLIYHSFSIKPIWCRFIYVNKVQQHQQLRVIIQGFIIQDQFDQEKHFYIIPCLGQVIYQGKVKMSMQILVIKITNQIQVSNVYKSTIINNMGIPQLYIFLIQNTTKYHLNLIIYFIIQVAKIFLQNKINNPINILGSQQTIMKNKKKSSNPKPIQPIKLLNIKTLQPQKNTASTQQKTYLTIQSNHKTFQYAQTQSNRQSFKARFSFNKKSTLERMEQNNLSPFSNDGRSQSPKYRKTPQKLVTPKDLKQVKFTINLKQLQKKKAPKSTKVSSARQSYNNKKVVINNKTVTNNNVEQKINKDSSQVKKKAQLKKKKSDKNEKQQKARIQFQNEFLSMMNNRIHKQKITQMSDQQLQGSIGKRTKPKLQILIQSDTQSKQSNNGSRQDKKLQHKRQIVKTMRIKVMKNIQRDYPNLDINEKKVICAVIIIQRLWRQRKVKQFFQHYVTPRASPQSSFRESLNKQISNNNSTYNLLTSHMRKKSQQYNSCDGVPKKKTTNFHPFNQDSFLIRQNSSQQCKGTDSHKKSVVNKTIMTNKNNSIKQQSKLNEQVNKLFEDSIISFENENEKIVRQEKDIGNVMKFIECYREIKLNNNKKVSRSRRNIFSLKQSLSQKCLMQKYYNKIFNDKPQKDKPKNYEIFESHRRSKSSYESIKQNKQSLIQQSSIELFKQINQHPDYISPQKLLYNQTFDKISEFDNKEELQLNNNKQLNLNQQVLNQNKQEDEQEQVWIRNDTNYSQQTDSDQLSNKKIQQTKNNQIKQQKLIKQKLVIDQICYTDSFIKKDFNNLNLNIKQQNLNQPNIDSISINQDEQCVGIVINHKSNNIEKNIIQNQLIGQKDINQSQNCQSLQTRKQIQKQYSLKQIQKVSDDVMADLMNQFFKQYISFTQKQCLVKKKKSKHKEQQKQTKPKLPGIQISQKSITQYLNILIPYILQNDRQQVIKSLQLFHPKTYQKCHRVQSVIYDLFQYNDEEQDDIYWNIISNEGFFQCLQKYWKQNVVLTKQKQKFKNFIDLTYKVYNRCITDAFSQLFNKQVLQKIMYSWNHHFLISNHHTTNKHSNKLVKDCLSIQNINKQDMRNKKYQPNKYEKIKFKRYQKAIANENIINQIVDQVKQKLLIQSFCYSTTGGKLIKRQSKRTRKQYEFVQFNQLNQLGQQKEMDKIYQKLSQQEQNKIIKITNDEFIQDERELNNCYDQKYQLNLDLTQSIFNSLLEEIEQQIKQIQTKEQQVQINEQNHQDNEKYVDKQQVQIKEQKALSKSQNQQFLQTNQTLQTNYHF